MNEIIEAIRENALFIVIFFLIWCALYLERIARNVAEIRRMIAFEVLRRRD
jgi:hypothetical protein